MKAGLNISSNILKERDNKRDTLIAAPNTLILYISNGKKNTIATRKKRTIEEKCIRE
ncbi:MAG: hypothetical protein ACOC80_16580 [Petrotogales bacterium]